MQGAASQRGNNLAVIWGLTKVATTIIRLITVFLAPQPVVEGSETSICWTDGATPQSIQTSFFAATCDPT